MLAISAYIGQADGIKMVMIQYVQDIRGDVESMQVCPFPKYPGCLRSRHPPYFPTKSTNTHIRTLHLLDRRYHRQRVDP